MRMRTIEAEKYTITEHIRLLYHDLLLASQSWMSLQLFQYRLVCLIPTMSSYIHASRPQPKISFSAPSTSS